jgi:ABC-type amino acid transport system permease subunit
MENTVENIQQREIEIGYSFFDQLTFDQRQLSSVFTPPDEALVVRSPVITS